MRSAVGRFHDEDVRRCWLARLSGASAAQFKITSVEQPLAIDFDEAHGAAEDVAGRQQSYRAGQTIDLLWLLPLEHMLLSHSGNARLHEALCGRAEDDFAMSGSVVGMCVADENFVRSNFWLVGIQPEIELRQVQVTLDVFEP